MSSLCDERGHSIEGLKDTTQGRVDERSPWVQRVYTDLAVVTHSDTDGPHGRSRTDQEGRVRTLKLIDCGPPVATSDISLCSDTDYGSIPVVFYSFIDLV